MATLEVIFEIEELTLADIVGIQIHQGRRNPADIEVEIDAAVRKTDGEVFKRIRATKSSPAAHLVPLRNALEAVLALINEEDLGFPAPGPPPDPGPPGPEPEPEQPDPGPPAP